MYAETMILKQMQQKPITVCGSVLRLRRLQRLFMIEEFSAMGWWWKLCWWERSSHSDEEAGCFDYKNMAGNERSSLTQWGHCKLHHCNLSADNNDNIQYMKLRDMIRKHISPNFALGIKEKFPILTELRPCLSPFTQQLVVLVPLLCTPSHCTANCTTPCTAPPQHLHICMWCTYACTYDVHFSLPAEHCIQR